MPSLGSVTEGMVGTQLDLQAIQKGQQQLQLGQYALAEAPIKLQEEQMTLQKEKIQLAQQMRMFSLMQNIHPPKDNSPASIADSLMEVSNAYMQSGMPDAAAKSAKEASGILENASKIDSRSYRIQSDRLSKFSNILNAVPDSPQGFAQAIQAMVAADPTAAKDQRFVRLAQQPWQPGLIDSIKKGVLTAKEQAEIDYRKKAGDHAEAAAVADRARVGLIKAQTTLAEDRDVKVKKEGGDVPIVKPSQLKIITDLADPHGTYDAADIRNRSRPVAEEMLRMRRENPTLTESEAGRRAYEAAYSRGDFSGLRETPVAPGAKPGKGLPMPKPAAGMTKEQYISKFRENQWYDVNGVPMLARGGKLWSEAELRGADKQAAADDDDDDDEDSED